eukprot:14413455-Ditylum_brightwellii.AAC.1
MPRAGALRRACSSRVECRSRRGSTPPRRRGESTRQPHRHHLLQPAAVDSPRAAWAPSPLLAVVRLMGAKGCL